MRNAGWAGGQIGVGAGPGDSHSGLTGEMRNEKRWVGRWSDRRRRWARRQPRSIVAATAVGDPQEKRDMRNGCGPGGLGM